MKRLSCVRSSQQDSQWDGRRVRAGPGSDSTRERGRSTRGASRQSRGDAGVSLCPGTAPHYDSGHQAQ